MPIWNMEKVYERCPNKVTDILSTDSEFAQHFDGKRLNGTGFLVVCLKGLNEFYKLCVCECRSGSANDVFNEISKKISELIVVHPIK